MRIKKQDGTPKAVRLDDDDNRLLEAVSKFERLSYSDILRRALRQYAKTLGIEPERQENACR